MTHSETLAHQKGYVSAGSKDRYITRFLAQCRLSLKVLSSCSRFKTKQNKQEQQPGGGGAPL